MQRLLHVTYGYLKFGFVSVLAGTIFFALVGLAAISPRTFLLVILIGVAVFLLARSELQITRRHQELRGKPLTPELAQETLTQVLAFTQATSILVYGMASVAGAEAQTLIVMEWIFKRAKTVNPDSISLVDGSILSNDEISLAGKALDRHRKELRKIGLTPLFISKQRANEIMRSFQERSLNNQTYSFPEVPGDSNIVSIGFVQDNKVARTPSVVIAEILQDSFTLFSAGSMNPPSEPLHPQTS